MAYKMELSIALLVFLCAVGGSGGMSPRDEEVIRALPRAAAFFRAGDIYEGDQIRMGLPKQPVEPFISREKADSIPFSSAGLPTALKMLRIPEGSRMARRMASTLSQCEMRLPSHEKSFCANSLESFADQATSMLGPRARPLETTASSKGNIYARGEMQVYTITRLSFATKPSSRSLSCHPMDYAYAMFFCHEVYQTRVYKLLLEGEDGTTVDALALCHFDTTYWDPDHLAFKVLRLKAGQAEVCHIVPEGHIVWVADD